MNKFLSKRLSLMIRQYLVQLHEKERNKTLNLNGTQTNDSVIALRYSTSELSNPGEADQMRICVVRKGKEEHDHRKSCYL